MECTKCQKDPGFHNFEFMSRLPTGDTVWYTCPSKGKQRDMKEEHIQDYVAHMDQASLSSWIWIFDCSGLESFHLPKLRVLERFTSVVQERYKFVLKHIFIININWKMNMILHLIKPFMKEEAKERLKIINSRLELLSLGIEASVLQRLKK